MRLILVFCALQMSALLFAANDPQNINVEIGRMQDGQIIVGQGGRPRIVDAGGDLSISADGTFTVISTRVATAGGTASNFIVGGTITAGSQTAGANTITGTLAVSGTVTAGSVTTGGLITANGGLTSTAGTFSGALNGLTVSGSFIGTQGAVFAAAGTGTGSDQGYAHGLGTTPSVYCVYAYDTSGVHASVGTYTVAGTWIITPSVGATYITVNATTGLKYRVEAVK